MLDNPINDDGAAAIAQRISSPNCQLNTLKLAGLSDYLFFLVSSPLLLSDWDSFVLFGVLHCAMEVSADIRASVPYSSSCFGVVFSPPPYNLFDSLSDHGCRCSHAGHRTPIRRLSIARIVPFKLSERDYILVSLIPVYFV